MPQGVLMLTAHYLCHWDSQGWTLSTPFQKQSLKQKTLMSVLTGTKWAPLETQPGPHCLCNPMLSHHPPWSSWERSQVNWQHFPCFLVRGVKEQWRYACSSFLCLGKGYMDYVFWSGHSACGAYTGKLRLESREFVRCFYKFSGPSMASWFWSLCNVGGMR